MNADSRAYSQRQQATSSLFGTASKFQSNSETICVRLGMSSSKSPIHFQHVQACLNSRSDPGRIQRLPLLIHDQESFNFIGTNNSSVSEQRANENVQFPDVGRV